MKMKHVGWVAGCGLLFAGLVSSPVMADAPESYDARAAFESVGEDRAAQIFRRTCQACHGRGQGFMGAPRIEREQDWEWRLDARGFDMLVHNTIRGIGAMPPRGGNSQLSDEEIAAVMYYIFQETGISIDE